MKKTTNLFCLLFFMLLFSNCKIFCQENSCFVNDSPGPPVITTNTFTFSDYNDAPEITIYVNFYYHLCQTECGYNNSIFPYPLDTATLITQAHQLVYWANYYLDNMPPNAMAGPGGLRSAHVPRAKWRYEIYTDPNNTNDKYDGIWFVKNENNTFAYKGNIINVALNKNRTWTQYCYSAAANPYVLNGAEYALSMYNLYKCGGPDKIQWEARIFNHEVAHVLGLEHANSCDNECKLIDLSPTEECNPNCPSQALCDGYNPEKIDCAALGGQNVSKCTWGWGNNLMQQGFKMAALTPCQWEKAYNIAYNYLHNGTPVFNASIPQNECCMVASEVCYTKFLFNNDTVVNNKDYYAFGKNSYSLQIISDNLIYKIVIENSIGTKWEYETNELSINFSMLTDYSCDNFKITIYSIENNCPNLLVFFDVTYYAGPKTFIDDQEVFLSGTINLCYGVHTIKIVNDDWRIYSVKKAKCEDPYNGQWIDVNNFSSFEILASNSCFVYNVSIAKLSGSCSQGRSFKVIGECCSPPCAESCVLDAFPNPASENVSVRSVATGLSPSGVTYTPVIREINVYNRYMQRVKSVIAGDVTIYSLNVIDLNNNEFYIIESKDQYNNACRKTIMISR